MRADTGVGPAIASGSQTYKRNLRRLSGRAHQEQQRDGGEDSCARFYRQAFCRVKYFAEIERSKFAG